MNRPPQQNRCPPQLSKRGQRHAGVLDEIAFVVTLVQAQGDDTHIERFPVEMRGALLDV